jgi:hypothetical protein
VLFGFGVAVPVETTALIDLKVEVGRIGEGQHIPVAAVPLVGNPASWTGALLADLLTIRGITKTIAVEISVARDLTQADAGTSGPSAGLARIA